MASDNEGQRAKTANSGRQPRQIPTGTVSAEDIRRLVAKLKGEEAKK